MDNPAPIPRRSLRDRFPWLFRRAWVIVVCTVLVVVAAFTASRHQRATYTANAILLVKPGATKSSPGAPQEAQALAATYAGLIPNDSSVVATVAAATGLSTPQVARDTTVTVINGTSLLNIRFTAATAAEALQGANAMADSLSGATPVTTAIPGGTVTVTKPATDATRHLTSKTVVLGLSLLLGLLLGGVITIIWERTDARFDKPEQITDELGIPARALAALNDVAVLAVMRQWRTLALHRAGDDEGHVPRVALVPAVPRVRQRVARLAEMLKAAAWPGSMKISTSIADARSEELLLEQGSSFQNALVAAAGSAERNGLQGRLPRPGAVGPPSYGLEVLVGGQPGTEGGEAVSQQAHVTVLVVPAGSRVKEVRRSVALLAELGSTPVWTLMPGRTGRSDQRYDQRREDGRREPVTAMPLAAPPRR
jgi:capsular polysaccharide biosynthesis protein